MILINGAGTNDVTRSVIRMNFRRRWDNKVLCSTIQDDVMLELWLALVILTKTSRETLAHMHTSRSI